jgi:hypothetical protein
MFRISRNPVRYIHKILEQKFMTTYSYAILPIIAAIQKS